MARARTSLVGYDQGFAGDDLLEAGGEVFFQIGHTGCFHVAGIARFLTEANEENKGNGITSDLKLEI